MEVGKGLVTTVGVGFALMLAALAFLLGRESSRHAPDVPRGVVEAPVAQPVAAAVPVVPAAAPVVPTVPLEQPAPEPSPRPTPRPAAAPTPTPRGGADGAAIREYFRAVAAIQASGPAGDANAFANELMSAAMDGDTSGFDKLIHTAESGVARAQKLSVPPACQTYHQEMLSVLDDSVQMLRTVRSALAGQDIDALQSLTSKATALQGRVDHLQAEERKIKEQFGITD